MPPSFTPVAQHSAETLGNETVADRDGRLTDDETSFILESSLRTKHREDHKVIEFIDNFIRCKDIGQASAETGVARSVGYKWRYQKDIALAIQRLIDKSAVKHGMDSSEILERVAEQVNFDPIMLQNPDGTFKSNMHDIPPEARRNIKEFEAKNIWGEDRNGVKIIVGELIKVKFYDKQKAVELIGKEKEMFKNTTKVEHTISNDMANILLDATKRGQQASLEYRKSVVEVKGEVVE